MLEKKTQRNTELEKSVINMENSDRVLTPEVIQVAFGSSNNLKVWNQYEETVGLRTAIPQSSCHVDGSSDGDFTAKDLLCFAWQIAKGMVRMNKTLPCVRKRN